MKNEKYECNCEVVDYIPSTNTKRAIFASSWFPLSEEAREKWRKEREEYKKQELERTKQNPERYLSMGVRYLNGIDLTEYVKK